MNEDVANRLTAFERIVLRTMFGGNGEWRMENGESDMMNN